MHHPEDEVKLTVRRMNRLMENVILLFDRLDTENFDSVYPLILSDMAETGKIKEMLLGAHPLEELMIYEPVLALKAKLIREKYDNTLKSFLQEGKELEKKINCLLQKKKLINYQRYENGNQGSFKKFSTVRKFKSEEKRLRP
jgi:hypothetical protein